MKQPRKYCQGRHFGSFGEFTRYAIAGGYVWFASKPYHGHVLINWKMIDVVDAVAQGHFRYADVSVDYLLWYEKNREMLEDSVYQNYKWIQRFDRINRLKLFVK